MSAPKSLNFLSIYLLRSSPSFWAAQNDKRPTRYGSACIIVAASSCSRLNDANFIECLFENLQPCAGASGWDRIRQPEAARNRKRETVPQLLIRQSTEDSWIGDLVTVEMEDRQYRAV